MRALVPGKAFPHTHPHPRSTATDSSLPKFLGSSRLFSLQNGQKKLSKGRRRATENDAWEKRILVRWGLAGKIVSFFTILLIRHLVVVEPKVMPDLVHDGITHFLHHFLFGTTQSENWPAIDGDFCRQLAARLEERFFVDGEALIEAEKIFVFLHFEIGEDFG